MHKIDELEDIERSLADGRYTNDQLVLLLNTFPQLLAVVWASQKAVKASFDCGRVDPAEMYNALAALEDK